MTIEFKKASEFWNWPIELYWKTISLSTWIFVWFDNLLVPVYTLAPLTILEIGTVLYELSLKFDERLRYLQVIGEFIALVVIY